ncbi:MAG: Hint domain-containing protein [Paracoccaceae bacterium]|nr:MAG: Hint domain-containing protein [Paracoccaceae bacterium]
MAGGWIALSGAAGATIPAADQGLTFAMELDLPLRGPAVALDWRTPSADAALSVLADPDTGISMLLRQGGRTLRARLPGTEGLALTGTGQIVMTCAPDCGGWMLRLVPPEPGATRAARGRGGIATDPASIAVLGAAALASGTGGGIVRHPAVLWFGFADGMAVPAPIPWIGPATPVATPAGPRAAARLRAGDVVSTLAGPRPLLRTERIDTPAAGTRAPVRLRAPWFGRSADLLVSAVQPVRLAGVGVEYLFGCEAVMARAGHLAGREAALSDPRSAPVTGVSLTLAPDASPGADVILADGCALPVGSAECLAAIDAVPLRLHLGPGVRARAA